MTWSPGWRLVYALVDPRKPREIRYIGQTSRPRTRLRDHALRSAAPPASRRAAWVHELSRAGVTPALLPIEFTPGLLALPCETRWIAVAELLGHDLLNEPPSRRPPFEREVLDELAKEPARLEEAARALDAVLAAPSLRLQP